MQAPHRKIYVSSQHLGYYPTSSYRIHSSCRWDTTPHKTSTRPLIPVWEQTPPAARIAFSLAVGFDSVKKKHRICAIIRSFTGKKSGTGRIVDHTPVVTESAYIKHGTGLELFQESAQPCILSTPLSTVTMTECKIPSFNDVKSIKIHGSSSTVYKHIIRSLRLLSQTPH